jgi:hypothetical protein
MCFTKLKHLIFWNGGSILERKQQESLELERTNCILVLNNWRSSSPDADVDERRWRRDTRWRRRCTRTAENSALPAGSPRHGARLASFSLSQQYHSRSIADSASDLREQVAVKDHGQIDRRRGPWPWTVNRQSTERSTGAGGQCQNACVLRRSSVAADLIG